MSSEDSQSKNDGVTDSQKEEQSVLDSDQTARAAMLFGQGFTRAQASAQLGVSALQTKAFNSLWAGMKEEKKWLKNLKHSSTSEPPLELAEWPDRWQERRITEPDFQKELRDSELSEFISENVKEWGVDDAWEPRSPSRDQAFLALTFAALKFEDDWVFSVRQESHHLILYSEQSQAVITIQVVESADKNQCRIRVYPGSLTKETFEGKSPKTAILSSEHQAQSVLNALMNWLYINT